MENVVPPFKVDVAGTFLLPAALREAREQYRNEQISLAARLYVRIGWYPVPG